MKLPRKIETRGVPVLAWSRELSRETERQLTRLAQQPWVRHHVAAMPDAHVSEGVAVGTVFATADVVVPGALGGDLGCGVAAIRFPIDASTIPRATLERVLSRWAERIPVGDERHRRAEAGTSLKGELSTRDLEHTRRRLEPRDLGTLGGGNHFIELDRAHDGTTWLLVHSGSRGLGSAIGHHHQRVAGNALGALSLESDAGRACLHDLSWAFSFARANRDELLRVAREIVEDELQSSAQQETHVDVHHNFVARERHFGEELLVHRKGAIAAPVDALAIIPGSMGTASYLVRGLGLDAAFASASHGAGRVLTRREAREQIRVARLERELRRVVHDEHRRESLVEEAPSAYRDIVEVLEDEEDLVAPVLRLEPIVVLKG
ncbi:MAG: RtcB family protein [Archangium sp.]